MITFFSIPKPFDQDHIATIQHNAIRSWCKLGDDIEILIFGNEYGFDSLMEISDKIRIFNDIKKNELGTPLLDSIFNTVKKESKHNLRCYVNCDIILLNDFISTANKINFEKFLMIGHRWNLDLKEYINFESHSWESELIARKNKYGSLNAPASSDYFLYTEKTEFDDFPPFVVGRPVWDNWLIYKARKLGYPVIDATESTNVIHQNHDYKHVKMASYKWEGPEADYNRKLVSNWRIDNFSVADSTHKIVGKRVVANLGVNYFLRIWQLIPLFYPGLNFLHSFGQRIKSIFKHTKK